MSTTKFPFMALKLYGVPLSQPTRSVAWTLMQLEFPFDFQMAVPGMKSKMGTQHEQFKALTPHQSAHVPLLTYYTSSSSSSSSSSSEAVVTLSESPAILTHLCELHQQVDHQRATAALLYPSSGTIAKAKVDSYLHWHHDNTRIPLAKVFQTKVRPDLNVTLSDEDWNQVQILLQTLETGWIPYGKKDHPSSQPLFLGGLDHPTIADILAYGELSSLTMTNLLEVDEREFPLLNEWMHQMTQLPYHDQAHRALTHLGDLSDLSPKEVSKKLGAATKAGMEGFQQPEEHQ